MSVYNFKCVLIFFYLSLRGYSVTRESRGNSGIWFGKFLPNQRRIFYWNQRKILSMNVILKIILKKIIFRFSPDTVIKLFTFFKNVVKSLFLNILQYFFFLLFEINIFFIFLFLGVKEMGMVLHLFEGGINIFSTLNRDS